VKVRLQYFDDCPSWQQAATHLESLRDDYDLDIRLEHVDSEEAAHRVVFRGSPTILVDGRDLFSTDGTAIGLSCRRYPTPAGVAGCPNLQQIDEALEQRRGRT
jgi:hypothetical protein